MIAYFYDNYLNECTHRYIEASTDYQLIKQLGEGAYGVAYLLKHVTSKQHLVLKRLKAKRFSKKNQAKFQQEIYFLQQLQHIAVPRFILAGTIKKAPFYIMSYAEGETFEQAIFARKARFSIQDILSFTAQLLTLVEHMHTLSIVHRDLRIPNLILKDEQLTIIDFGLATMIEPTFSVTQLKNPKKATHPISDLYAVGHFMLFLLYSQYEPTSKKSMSWQQELKLPPLLQHFIERLLTIHAPFLTAVEAQQELQHIKTVLI